MVVKGLVYCTLNCMPFIRKPTLLDVSPKQGLLGYHACFFMAVSPAPKHILVWWSYPLLFRTCCCLCWRLSDLFCSRYEGRAVDLFISVWRWIFLLIGRLTHWPLTPLCASFPCVLLSATPLGEFSGVYLITDWLVFLFLNIYIYFFPSFWHLHGFNVNINILVYYN